MKRLSEDEVVELAEQATRTATGERLLAREARYAMLSRLAHGNPADVAAALVESPDDGAAMATAAIQELPEGERTLLSTAAEKQVLGRCLNAANELQAAITSLLIDSDALDPETVALFAATSSGMPRAKGRGD